MGQTGTVRWQSSGIAALQEMAEAFLVSEFESMSYHYYAHSLVPADRYIVTQFCAFHAKRVTIYDRDMRLVERIRGCLTGIRTWNAFLSV